MKVYERPDLMEKWVFEKNEALGISPYQISTGSEKKVWWRCNAKHHLYPRNIDREAKGKPQCPTCKKDNQKYLSDYPELLKEFAYDLNDVSPEELTAGSDIPVQWRCIQHEHVWQNSPYHRIKEQSKCPYCLNRKTLQGFNDLLTMNPPYLKNWDYDKNDKDGILACNYNLGSQHKAWWICDKGHHTYDLISSVMDRKKTPCSECQKEIKRASAEASAENKIQKETKAKKRTDAKIRQESIILENQKRKMSIVDSVVQFWDYDENQKRGSKFEDIALNRVYCWKCSNGHKWKKDLSHMLSNPECPKCFIEENSISRKFPNLADIYNVEMNRGIPPEKCLAVSAKYYWWTCQRGHTYIATLDNVATHKETGCMYCDKGKSYYSL
jgi:hypothetical protein